MDGAAGLIPLQLGQIEGFGHDPLAGESRFPVNQNRHHAGALPVAQVVLLGVDNALYDRVHQLQMAGIRAEGEVHPAPIGGHLVIRVPHVVLHVPFIVESVAPRLPFEFAEDDLVRFVEQMGQDVEPAAVGHADDQFLQSQFGASGDQDVEQRQQGVGPFQ